MQIGYGLVENELNIYWTDRAVIVHMDSLRIFKQVVNQAVHTLRAVDSKVDVLQSLLIQTIRIASFQKLSIEATIRSGSLRS